MRGSLEGKIFEGGSANIDAWCHIILTERPPEMSNNPQQPLAVNAAAQSEYARLTDTSQAALSAAMERYLPIALVRLVILLGGPASTRWEQLIKRIEAALSLKD